uniref:IF rod domain-containing protein n=1 Tax=Gasterosteus aculeatus aculeatus TaxID=481459 RepID=A0AAQ4NTL0_GASAC|nr:desmin [Gasterosteus aculeatus aculeatus]
MAVLRVSSYRKLFEDEGQSGKGGLSTQCAGQHRAAGRGAALDECHCEQFDFVAAKALNKEGLQRFVQDRHIIATLNDRLVRLMDLARCFEEENESLKCQIVDAEKKLKGRRASARVSSAVAEADYGLDAVVERLRRERDETLCDTEDLRKELERLMEEYEKAAQQKILLQQGRQDVAEDVDAVTAECLALREQVAIYEEQLANMEDQHTTAVERLMGPAEGTTGATAAFPLGGPDITPALDVKEYYCQLAESLQHECGAASSAVGRRGDGEQREEGVAAGSTVKGASATKDVCEIKTLISELQKALAELERRNEELEDEVEMKAAAYADELAELEWTVDEVQRQEADFQVQMKQQCEDYKELFSEKMARDMEITAYRSLVAEEEERLCNL